MGTNGFVHDENLTMTEVMTESAEMLASNAPQADTCRGTAHSTIMQHVRFASRRYPFKRLKVVAKRTFQASLGQVLSVRDRF
jgi:hypothetical protein